MGQLVFPWGFCVVLTCITRKEFDAAEPRNCTLGCDSVERSVS